MDRYNKTLQRYLEKSALFTKFISSTAAPNLGIIIVIPSYHEKELEIALDSLLECNMPPTGVEVLVILNHSETESKDIAEFHINQSNLLLEKYQDVDKIKIHFIGPIVFPKKHAGVGSARKVGMDEAVRRFLEAGNIQGIILNYDADCMCKPDYLMETYKYFKTQDHKSAISIGFQHRISDLEEPALSAIQLYEKHLHYYINAQALFNYPFAFQTLGSCFAVEVIAYCQQGGMNRRQAGEDFYFLHKFSKIGQLGFLDKVLVFPSGRISTRVPFGTGRAVGEIVSMQTEFTTYNFTAIKIFCQLLNRIPAWFSMDEQRITLDLRNYNEKIYNFLFQIDFLSSLHKIKQNTSNSLTFIQKTKQELDSFCLMKWLHYAREQGYPDLNLQKAINEYLEHSSKEKM